jgi:MATE family multidrug resistance protein
MPPPSNVDERAPLLAHQVHGERASAVAVVVSPSSSSVTEVEIPNQEACSHQRTLDFKLFKSLLVDSIPGKNHHSRFEEGNWVLIAKTWIVILSYTLQNSIQTVSVVIAGRLGPDELSVAAFSLMLAFVTGESWIL